MEPLDPLKPRQRPSAKKASPDRTEPSGDMYTAGKADLHKDHPPLLRTSQSDSLGGPQPPSTRSERQHSAGEQEGQARRQARADGTSESEQAGQQRRANRNKGQGSTGPAASDADGSSTTEPAVGTPGSASTPETQDPSLPSANGRPGAIGAGPSLPTGSETPRAAGPAMPAGGDSSVPAAGQGSTAHKIDVRGTRGDNYHYRQQNGVETFTISNIDKPSGEKHDPRVEATFSGAKFSAGQQKTFNGRFTIEQGKDTTIAQLLNSNPSSSDKNKPSAFVTYEDGALYLGHKSAGRKLVNVTPGREFELTMKSDGRTTNIFVNGQHVGRDQARPGGQNYFRYGAYMHGGKNTNQEVKAIIHARNVTIS
ncbi:MAG: hypothetical protein AAF449_00165 [Myxococcota bacterium]